MNYLMLLAQIVAVADEIRENMKAKGEEAARQFEEAVRRNRKSFAEMVEDAGGGDLNDTPEPLPPPSDARYNEPVAFYPTVPPFAVGDHIYKRGDGKYLVTEARFGLVGFPGAEYIGDL